MDPVTALLEALAAGGTALTSVAVEDLYTKVKSAVWSAARKMWESRKLDSRMVELTLTKYEEKPEIWKEPMKEILLEIEAHRDESILRDTALLLRLLQESRAAPRGLDLDLTYLRGLTSHQLNAMLSDSGSAHTEFFQKYVMQVFFHREGADELFARFVRQDPAEGKCCFLVAGKAGKGKTNLLCHLAESLLHLPETLLPVLLSASDLRLDDRELAATVVRRLFERSDVPKDEIARFELSALAKRITELGGGLVVFFDGLNELEGRDAFRRFSEQLDELILTSRRDRSRLLFCLSCRSEVWYHFKQAAWAQDHILREGRPSASAEPTLELGDFHEEDIDQISQDYFRWYGLEAQLLGSARQSCCDPLMLRYLCAAYTKRPSNDKSTPPDQIETQRLGEIRSLRRKEAFDMFVRNRRQAMYKAARRALRKDDERLIYRYTTLYLITMAYRMFEKGQAFLTVDDLIAVAHDLDHPDRLLADEGKEVFLRDSRSVFFQLVDEGVVLSKHAPGSYSFTFESYFEYSLGRYFAMERWPRLLAGSGSEAAVVADFRGLIRRHQALAEKDNFHNLFGACSYGILELEQGGDPGMAAERKHSPTLFIRLIEEMAKAGGEGLDWIQLACSTIRETVLAQPATWQVPAGERPFLEERLDLLMEVLEDLTRTSDWVVLWDVEETLIALARANSDLTLRHVRFWLEEGDGLQPVFGIQALLRLSRFHASEVRDLLLSVASQPRFQQDFWLARTLVAAAKALGSPTLGSPLSLPDREKLRQLLDTLAMESPVPSIRGVALAALPFVSRSRHLPRIRQRIAEETWPWALWNLAFELQDWSAGEDAEWLWETLERLAELPNAHVRYAVDCVVDRLRDSMPEDRCKAIGQRLRGNRWRKNHFSSFIQAGAGKVGVVYSPAFLEPAYDNHVECRERIQVIVDKLERVAPDRFSWIDPRMATSAEVRLAHSRFSDRHRDRSPWPYYLEDVMESSRLRRERGGSSLRTRSGPSELRFESYEAALLSAGGVLCGIDFVLKTEALAAFAINRPPGHLANNTICIFNNVAIAAEYARRTYVMDRVFIVDFDAHHGSHTYRVFREDSKVIYFSIHQEGNISAEAGLIRHTGEEEGEGFTFNVPYPSTMGDEGYTCIVDTLLIPLIREWQPGLILLSAGFDGHFDDPLTRGRLSEQAYIHLAERLRSVALDLGIKVVATLEGGYGLEGMANSLVHMLRVFGEWPIPLEAIGFTKRPADRRCDEAAGLAPARESVRKRVELMAELKARRPDYPFDLEGPHWRAVLEGESGPPQT